ncbi:protein PLANT CADMIUM RESISTANCE 7-like [Apium graveolens]|uniref:protein PLANT CADMIUM RESISTANCE 7-like n=1 Tax=Apium graveolens TaxID=4045 RepID=UPI003D79EF3C
MSRPDEENQDEQGEEQFDDQTADHGDYNLIPQHQPQQFQQVNQNPPVSQKPQAKPEDWNTELFGCLEDPSNALITAFFPCVTFGQIAEIIDNGHSKCTSQGVFYGAMWGCLVGMPCFVSYTYRTEMRRQYQLTGTPAPDLLIHCFCHPCALCQEYRELRHRGFDPSIGWQGNLSLQQQNYPMTPPANPGMMHK